MKSIYDLRLTIYALLALGAGCASDPFDVTTHYPAKYYQMINAEDKAWVEGDLDKLQPAPQLYSRQNKSELAPAPMIDIPLPPLPGTSGDLYSAPTLAGPWDLRTEEVLAVTNNGNVIWRIPHTPGATQEFYRIQPE